MAAVWLCSHCVVAETGYSRCMCSAVMVDVCSYVRVRTTWWYDNDHKLRRYLQSILGTENGLFITCTA